MLTLLLLSVVALLVIITNAEHSQQLRRALSTEEIPQQKSETQQIESLSTEETEDFQFGYAIFKEFPDSADNTCEGKPHVIRQLYSKTCLPMPAALRDFFGLDTNKEYELNYKINVNEPNEFQAQVYELSVLDCSGSVIATPPIRAAFVLLLEPDFTLNELFTKKVFGACEQSIARRQLCDSCDEFDKYETWSFQLEPFDTKSLYTTEETTGYYVEDLYFYNQQACLAGDIPFSSFQFSLNTCIESVSFNTLGTQVFSKPYQKVTCTEEDKPFFLEARFLDDFKDASFCIGPTEMSKRSQSLIYTKPMESTYNMPLRFRFPNSKCQGAPMDGGLTIYSNEGGQTENAPVGTVCQESGDVSVGVPFGRGFKTAYVVDAEIEYCKYGTFSEYKSKSNYCCAECDGTCGGPGCSSRPGGSKKCCTGQITEPCKTEEDVACIAPIER